MSELPPRGHVSARKRFLAERGNLRWILSMVAVAAVFVRIVLVLIYRERSRTAGDPPANRWAGLPLASVGDLTQERRISSS